MPKLVVDNEPMNTETKNITYTDVINKLFGGKPVAVSVTPRMVPVTAMRSIEMCTSWGKRRRQKHHDNEAYGTRS